MQKQITYTILPSYATQIPDVIWTSEDPTVAAVDQNGLITAVGAKVTKNCNKAGK